MPRPLIQVHPAQTVELPGGGHADIDDGMVELLTLIWAHRLTTTGCCQDYGDSIAYNGITPPGPPHGKSRHATFYSGYAWLKLPLQDGMAFLDLVVRDSDLRQRTSGWTRPDAWQAVTYTYAGNSPADDGRTVAMEPALHITFPNRQIPQVVAVMRGSLRSVTGPSRRLGASP